MNCTTFEEEWASNSIAAPTADTLQPVSWSPAAHEHLQNCVACQKKIAADHVLLRALPLLRRTMPPPPSTARILESLNRTAHEPQVRNHVTESQPHRSRARFWWPAVTAIAAASIIVAMMVFPSTSQQTTATLPPASRAKQEFSIPLPALPKAQPLHIDQQPLMAEVESEEPLVTASMASLWQEVRTSSASMARATVSPTARPLGSSFESAETSSIPRSTVALETLVARMEPSRWVPFRTSSVPDAAPQPPENFPSTPGWIERSTPVSQQVTEAFKFLGEALPTLAEPAS